MKVFSFSSDSNYLKFASLENNLTLYALRLGKGVFLFKAEV